MWMYVYLYRSPVFPSTCQKLLCRSVPPCHAFLYRPCPCHTTTLNTLLYVIRTRVRENSTSQCLSNRTKHEYNLRFNSKLIRTVHYTPKAFAAGNACTYYYYHHHRYCCCHCWLLLLSYLAVLYVHHLHMLLLKQRLPLTSLSLLFSPIIFTCVQHREIT